MNDGAHSDHDDPGHAESGTPVHAGHSHGGHSHGVTAEADHRYLSIALGLIVGFMVVEVATAFVSGSLALFADAGHMLADVGAIAGSLWALRLAQRPASNKWSFGLKRAEILAAAVNGVTLLVVGMLVMFEGVRRLVDPPAVEGVPLVVVAVIGVAVNVVATWVLAKANRSSLNVEGAFQHILTDLYGFIGTAIAGVVVITTGWRRADPVASLVVVVLVLRAAWGLLRASGHVLLEGTPEAVDLDDVRRHITELPEVLSVHDLHAWTLTSDLPALSAHVVVTEACLNDATRVLVLASAAAAAALIVVVMSTRDSGPTTTQSNTTESAPTSTSAVVTSQPTITAEPHADESPGARSEQRAVSSSIRWPPSRTAASPSTEPSRPPT